MTRVGGIFNFSDRIQMEVLNQRLKRNQVINTNISNQETPGFRAIGYDFERQVQSVYNANDTNNLQTSNKKHMINNTSLADSKIRPRVYIQPQESIGEDGNTVDLDKEMASLAKNQILYQATIDTINKKIAILKYAISGGR